MVRYHDWYSKCSHGEHLRAEGSESNCDTKADETDAVGQFDPAPTPMIWWIQSTSARPVRPGRD